MNTNALSSLLGGALGDALGYSREFSKIKEILNALPDRDWHNANFNNAPPDSITGKDGTVQVIPGDRRDQDGKVLISDDTQMTIATGRARLLADPDTTNPPQDMADELVRVYTAWSIHPDNHRAPGMACTRATSNLRAGLSWQDATDINTLGCGANMRVAPIALIPDIGGRTLRDVAMLSAAITHAHPAALAATALTADAIHAVQGGYGSDDLLDFLIFEANWAAKSPMYPYWVLGDLWESSEYNSPEAYMRAGYRICVEGLNRVKKAISKGWAGQTDPCTITGEAWTAPSALAGAVLCTVGLWDTPVDVLRRAAVSNGDSDSLAAIAGNIRGAAGVDWPDSWVNDLEIGPVLELNKIAQGL